MGKLRKKTMGMKLIKDEIRTICVVMLASSLILVGVISSVLNITTMRTTLEKTMTETAQVAADQVCYHLDATANSLIVIGSIARLTAESSTQSQKQAVLDTYREHYGWESLQITDANGKVMGESLNVGDTGYFKEAILGNTGFSEPVYSEAAGKMVVYIAEPLWEGGVIDSNIVGIVLASIDAKEFAALTGNIKVSENGASYMIDQEGNTIAHANFSLVETYSNTIKDAQADSGLKQLAKLEQNMIAGKSGFGTYSYNGITKYMAYVPAEINGWSVAITAPTSDFNGSIILSLVITVIVLIITMILATIVANKYGIRIGGAVHQCAERLKLLAEGDLTTEIPAIESEDETKILAESTAIIVETQHKIINDAKHLLNEMAVGNFAVRSKIGVDKYVGEYQELLDAMRALRDDMTRILRSITEASEQVEAGSAQLSSASQDLAEGSSEQTNAVDALLATVTVVTEQIAKNNDATDKAHDKIKIIGIEANESEKKMRELTDEMKKIEEVSAQINIIISEIEEIASQTNLLSLNASIEAARAGEAGRGFAVVADQIGKLAEQSAQSAVNTRHLIEASIQEISKGSKVTMDTAEHIERMMTDLNEMVLVLANVREGSESQTRAVAEIRDEVDQISNVVQSNSAAAEECSATSEELSAQAQFMEGLVAKFRLP